MKEHPIGWPHEHAPHHWCGPPHKPPHLRGLLHLAILKSLKDGPVHGAEVQRIIKEKYGVEAPPPAVYGLLRRLEEQGFVISTWETAESGPARRVYRITEEGLMYLEHSFEHMKKLKNLLDKLIE